MSADRSLKTIKPTFSESGDLPFDENPEPFLPTSVSRLWTSCHFYQHVGTSVWDIVGKFLCLRAKSPTAFSESDSVPWVKPDLSRIFDWITSNPQLFDRECKRFQKGISRHGSPIGAERGRNSPESPTFWKGIANDLRRASLSEKSMSNWIIFEVPERKIRQIT
jgi:hypothetical protein